MQPEQLGRYRIVKELGRGAMGRVFLAHDPQIDRNVAVKTVQIFSALPEADRAEARQRFLREARSAGKLLHPGIVTLFDVGEQDGLLYLAMECIEGDTLDRFCHPDTLLPVDTVVEMIASAAEALDYAHQGGIVHRDIKPANLMRVGDASVKIMDFGLAMPSQAELTNDGALFGTPSYMSPEQIRGRALDGRSDLFSLAVVLFEMLTGEKPFRGDSVSSIIYRIVNEPPRDPVTLEGRVPPGFDLLLARALSKSPDDRFASGSGFAAAVRRLGGGAPREPRAPVAPPAAAPRRVPEAAKGASRPRRSSRRPFILGAVLIVTLLAAAAYVYRDRLGWFAEPVEVWWEAQVRTEPAGLEVQLDGVPLDPEQAGRVRFQPQGPFGVLSASLGCRTVQRTIEPTDAAGEIVLVLDPTELAWSLDPSVENAEVQLNGKKIGSGAVELELDLCRENRLELLAAGFYPASVDIPEQATPVQARTLLAGIALQPIPMGRLALPQPDIEVVYYVDGKRIRGEGEIELPEGRYDLRMKNDGYWVDVRGQVTIKGGETTRADLVAPSLTTLVVQAFPANCKVYLRRPGGSWKYVDDTPLRRRLAVGRYGVRVKLNPTGETRDQEVELRAGENPPVRVAFGRSS